MHLLVAVTSPLQFDQSCLFEPSHQGGQSITIEIFKLRVPIAASNEKPLAIWLAIWLATLPVKPPTAALNNCPPKPGKFSAVPSSATRKDAIELAPAPAILTLKSANTFPRLTLVPSVVSDAANACASFWPTAPTTVPAASCTNWLLGASARPSADPSTWPTDEKSAVADWPSNFTWAAVSLPV